PDLRLATGVGYIVGSGERRIGDAPPLTPREPRKLALGGFPMGVGNDVNLFPVRVERRLEEMQREEARFGAPIRGVRCSPAPSHDDLASLGIRDKAAASKDGVIAAEFDQVAN